MNRDVKRLLVWRLNCCNGDEMVTQQGIHLHAVVAEARSREMTRFDWTMQVKTLSHSCGVCLLCLKVG